MNIGHNNVGDSNQRNKDQGKQRPVGICSESSYQITHYTDEAAFDERVQTLIRDELEPLGLFIEDDCRFETESLSMLLDFVEKNPSYHVATITDDESSEGEPENGFSYCVSNTVRVVNRQSYILCTGDKDPSLTLRAVFHFDN